MGRIKREPKVNLHRAMPDLPKARGCPAGRRFHRCHRQRRNRPRSSGSKSGGRLLEVVRHPSRRRPERRAAHHDRAEGRAGQRRNGGAGKVNARPDWLIVSSFRPRERLSKTAPTTRSGPDVVRVARAMLPERASSLGMRPRVGGFQPQLRTSASTESSTRQGALAAWKTPGRP